MSPLTFGCWKFSERHCGAQVSSVFYPSNFLTRTCYEEHVIHYYYFTARLFIVVGTIFKDPYFTFLACWNVKRRYAYLIICYDFRNNVIQPLSNFMISLLILLSGFCVLLNYGEYIISFLIYFSWITVHNCGSNVKFLLYHLIG